MGFNSPVPVHLLVVAAIAGLGWGARRNRQKGAVSQGSKIEGDDDEKGEEGEEGEDEEETGNKEDDAEGEKEPDAAVLKPSKLELLKGDFIRKLRDSKSFDIDLDNFPYYLSDRTKDLLLSTTNVYLKRLEFSKYTSFFLNLSNWILLSGPQGTEVYQEALVKALAKKLDAKVLIIDGEKFLPDDEVDGLPRKRFTEKPRDSGSPNSTEANESSLYNNIAKHLVGLATLLAAGVAAEAMTNARQSSENASSSGAEGSKNLTTRTHEEENLSASASADNVFTDTGEPTRTLKIGDRVTYVNVDGYSADVTVPSRPPKGATGQVVATYEAVGVRFDTPVPGGHSLSGLCDSGHGHICYASELRLEGGSGEEQENLKVAALAEVVTAEVKIGPLIVFIREAEQLAESSSAGTLFRAELSKVHGPVVFVGSYTEEEQDTEAGSERSAPDAEGSGATSDPLLEFFPNKITIQPPKDGPRLDIWHRQMEADAELLVALDNRRMLEEVLRWSEVQCNELEDVVITDLTLSDEDAEDLLGYAVGQHLKEAPSPVLQEGQLLIPASSILYGLSMLKAVQEDHRSLEEGTHGKEAKGSEKNLQQDTMSLAKKKLKRVSTDNKFEERILQEVVPARNVGVAFDEIGALEPVKQTLREVVMLPLQRPELFTRGQLTKPCRGILLFGPPGTGKTMLAKAVATEAGANFINISMSTILSKWLGEAEKSIKAVFSVASKIAPTVIFIDEVDSLLGKRGQWGEHETMRKIKNEFMACWDGLRTKAYERVLVLGATNRPFDLDEAIIRRFPRRLMVGLPDAENRDKILRVILKNEELAPAFAFAHLATLTEGYSPSDLKNLCVAAAYRPIRELLEEEEKNKKKAKEELRVLEELKEKDERSTKEEESRTADGDSVDSRGGLAGQREEGEGAAASSGNGGAHSAGKEEMETGVAVRAQETSGGESREETIAEEEKGRGPGDSSTVRTEEGAGIGDQEMTSNGVDSSGRLGRNEEAGSRGSTHEQNEGQQEGNGNGARETVAGGTVRSKADAVESEGRGRGQDGDREKEMREAETGEAGGPGGGDGLLSSTEAPLDRGEEGNAAEGPVAECNADAGRPAETTEASRSPRGGEEAAEKGGGCEDGPLGSGGSTSAGQEGHLSDSSAASRQWTSEEERPAESTEAGGQDGLQDAEGPRHLGLGGEAKGEEGCGKSVDGVVLPRAGAVAAGIAVEAALVEEDERAQSSGECASPECTSSMDPWGDRRGAGGREMDGGPQASGSVEEAKATAGEKDKAAAEGPESIQDARELWVGRESHIQQMAQLRALTMDDFLEAMKEVSSSTATEGSSMSELHQWNEMYGMGGSRRKAPLSYFL